MRLNILIAGDAGEGIRKSADILSESLVKEGLYVFNYRYYRSLISGGNNFNVICVSDEPVSSFDRDYDIAILLNEESFKIHEENIGRDSFSFLGFKEGSEEISKEKFEKMEKAKNMYFLGAIFKIMGLKKNKLVEVVKKNFEGKDLLEKDLEVINKAYNRDYVVKNGLREKINNLNFNEFREDIKYLDGSEAVGIGAIEGGIDVYLAYPMTPATPVLSFLSQNQENYGYITHQPENEIAVANAALGSSFSGAKTMIGSSGGGVDLMTETLSMQGMTELPLVCYLAMRGGPSSGAATFTSQEDLSMALNSGHGDFNRVVMAPGDSKEAYKKSKEAFYLAEKYGLLNIILSDKHLAESGYTQEVKEYGIFAKKNREIPGKKLVKRNSYTHDEDWNYTEDAETIEKMADKRREKFEKAKRDIEDNFFMYRVFGNPNSNRLILGFGSTKGAILDAIRNNGLDDFKYVHIIYLEPFSNELKKIINDSKEVFVVENNPSGQLSNLIERHTNKKIGKGNRILKYNARPFTPNEIIGKIK